MIWRQVAPVASPVSSRAVVEGVQAALGLRRDNRDALVEILRTRYNACDVVLTDSGTSALTLAFRAMLPRGAIVAYPGYACIDLTTAALGAGIRVRLYDIDPDTLSPNLDSVRRVIARGVDAIVVAHLLGYPADVVGVRKLAAEAGIPVIEDAAQAAGGMLGSALLGTLGDASILSFGRGKGTSAGAGGALLLRAPLLNERAERMRTDLRPSSLGVRQLVTLAAQGLLTHPALYWLPASIPALRLGEMVYRPPQPLRAMPKASAAVLPWALGLDEAEVRRRRERANQLLALVSDAPSLLAVRAVDGGRAGYLRLALIDCIGDRLPRTELGAVRGYPLTLDEHRELQPVLLKAEKSGRGSERLRDRLFTVPTHSRMNNTDIDRLKNWFVQPLARAAVLAV